MTDLERLALFATQVRVYGIHTKTNGLVRNKSIYMGLKAIKPNGKLGGMTRKQFAKVSVFNDAGEIVSVRGSTGFMKSDGRSKSYRAFGINRGIYKAATINIWMLTGLNVYGTDYVIDHIDGTDWNDSLDNLRIVHTSVNSILQATAPPTLQANGKYMVNLRLSMFGIPHFGNKQLDTAHDGDMLLQAVKSVTAYPDDPELLPAYLKRLRKPAGYTLAAIMRIANRLSNGSLDSMWFNKKNRFTLSKSGKAMKKYM